MAGTRLSWDEQRPCAPPRLPGVGQASSLRQALRPWRKKSLPDVEPPRPHPLSHGFQWRTRAPERRRRLTREELSEFESTGFVVMRRVFAPHEVAAVTEAIDPLEARAEARLREAGGRISISEADAITFTAHVAAQSPTLAAFARHPAIVDICHDLVGDDVRLYWDQSVYKKWQKPREFPWHQDNGYTFVEPQQYLTLWLPLVDVDEETGCPWIAPGLHRRGTFEHWATPDGLKCLETAPEATSAPAKAGDAIVFSSLAPHRTGPNLRPGYVRKAYILQYAHDPSTATYRDGRRALQDDPDRQFKVLEGGRPV
jgi:ectoine hydroxylase-related dioxygenase (phytanoyl-CoA dioxygenase family)